MQQQSRSENIKKRKIYWLPDPDQRAYSAPDPLAVGRGLFCPPPKEPYPCFRPYGPLPNAPTQFKAWIHPC